MSTQTKSFNPSINNTSVAKSAFNLNTSIRRVRDKWNAATRERRVQTARAMQEKLASMLMAADTCSLTTD